MPAAGANRQLHVGFLRELRVGFERHDGVRRGDGVEAAFRDRLSDGRKIIISVPRGDVREMAADERELLGAPELGIGVVPAVQEDVFTFLAADKCVSSRLCASLVSFNNS